MLDINYLQHCMDYFPCYFGCNEWVKYTFECGMIHILDFPHLFCKYAVRMKQCTCNSTTCKFEWFKYTFDCAWSVFHGTDRTGLKKKIESRYAHGTQIAEHHRPTYKHESFSVL